MLLQKSSALEKKISEMGTVWEYEYPSKLFSFATALIHGRYPEGKRSVNTECEQAYYVLSGSGTVHSEKGDFKVAEGDVYFFEKGEIYWVEGNKLSLVLVNAPKWFPEQHRIVD